MSRLIDADELIEWINEQREQVTKKQVAGTNGSIFTREALVTMQRCISTFENKINNQPTAFDTEKVVEQLNNEAYTTTDTVCGGMFEAIRLSSVIDIVKKGGAEWAKQ